MAEATFTDQNFQEEVLNSPTPVLVDFFATWCGPCKMLAPVVEELSNEYAGKVKVGKLDVDDNPVVAQTYGVQSIPTILFFKNGQLVDKMVGFQNKEVLEEKLDSLI